jgi:carboxylesterase type B
VALCVSRGDDGLFDEGDEDCLFLNVFVNKNMMDEVVQNKAASLPVAIFVHGECESSNSESEDQTLVRGEAN